MFQKNLEYTIFRSEIYNPDADKGQFACYLNKERPPNLHDNYLISGDNLIAMQLLLEYGYAGKLDFIYLDPPFMSQANYGFRKRYGNVRIDRPAYEDNWKGGIDEYLDMLHIRFQFMKDLLSDTGVICFHSDWRTIHYVKVMMDEIFGYDNLINEIIWTYTGGTDRSNGFAKKHDTILVYSKTGNYKFNPVYVDFSESTLKRFNKKDKDGRRYKENQLSDGRITRTYMKKQGKLCPDYWHRNILVSSHSESTGYRTQKPSFILERLIYAFTDEGDLIADFFAGGGTSLHAADKLNRKWIGTDKSPVAISACRYRMLEANATFFHAYITSVTNLEGRIIENPSLNERAENHAIYIFDENLVRIIQANEDSRENQCRRYALLTSPPGSIIVKKMVLELGRIANRFEALPAILASSYDYGIPYFHKDDGFYFYKQNPDLPDDISLGKIVIEGAVIDAPIVDFEINLEDGITLAIKDYEYSSFPIGLPSEMEEELIAKYRENPMNLIKFWAIDPNYNGNVFKAKYSSLVNHKSRGNYIPPERKIHIDVDDGNSVAFIIEDIFGIETRVLAAIE
ncbi:MAG: DNA methyltransferase [Candidatus Zixiibacteriota bacterium]